MVPAEGWLKQPRQNKILLYRYIEPNKPTKEGPLSYLFHESPVASVSTVSSSILDAWHFYAYSFLKVHIYVIKKSQNSRNQGFSLFLLVDWRVQIGSRIRTIKLRFRIQEAQKHRDPKQDPEYWSTGATLSVLSGVVIVKKIFTVSLKAEKENRQQFCHKFMCWWMSCELELLHIYNDDDVTFFLLLRCFSPAVAITPKTTFIIDILDPKNHSFVSDRSYANRCRFISLGADSPPSCKRSEGR
jgi:hypothetical protein